MTCVLVTTVGPALPPHARGEGGATLPAGPAAPAPLPTSKRPPGCGRSARRERLVALADNDRGGDHVTERHADTVPRAGGVRTRPVHMLAGRRAARSRAAGRILLLMGGCCEPEGYAATFGVAFSRRLARRYRRRGLDRTATRIVDVVAEHGVAGASVLEVGGGVGAIQLELLRRGAARTTNLELVEAYEADAAALAREAGVADRVTRRRIDLAQSPGAVEPHDVVVLHRVVCCYPDHHALLTAAAAHAGRLLVFSHPPRNLLSRAAAAGENLLFRLRGSPFRTYTHPPDAMMAAARSSGLELAYHRRGLAWHIVGVASPST